ncbi:MAG: bifunctional diaminohydroxyphosphoribosylaminopyrimidine deaminase/5-amino-6-(5-phosphoribosylamino)uracil reductase RibD [Tannerellaceae bacterium]|nr:bifunctional diaminohydroxyphosphoribosylaminopyrimidine deaminase/5-amino-6-(5-phosphoribosylamino)uracil reductase RibD [Tannerellaceae bacterium]
MLSDQIYMQRCLALARHGAGRTSPNPMVGAVVVHRGKVIGEGYHRRYGSEHAEVMAIKSVGDQSLLKESTLYVNLEPCSHYGQTPPCAALIIDKKIPKTVIGCQDPFPEVSGRGIAMLRAGGVEVVSGILEDEAIELNREFITFHTLKRPYIYLKWAQSSDGFIDRNRSSFKEQPLVLSSERSLQAVHRKRAEAAAIMVGTRTAILDNPALTVRRWAGTSPLRITLDRHLRIPPTHRILDGSLPTIVFTEQPSASKPNLEFVQIEFGRNTLAQVLDNLYQRRLLSLIVEGGASLLESFMSEGLWDEIQVETTPLRLGDGVRGPSLKCETNINIRTWAKGI